MPILLVWIVYENKSSLSYLFLLWAKSKFLMFISSSIHRQTPTFPISSFNTIPFFSHPQNQGSNFMLSFILIRIFFCCQCSLFFFAETESIPIPIPLNGCGTQGIAFQQPRSSHYPWRSHQGLHHATNCGLAFSNFVVLYYCSCVFQEFDFFTVISIADVQNQGPQSEPWFLFSRLGHVVSFFFFFF